MSHKSCSHPNYRLLHIHIYSASKNIDGGSPLDDRSWKKRVYSKNMPISHAYLILFQIVYKQSQLSRPLLKNKLIEGPSRPRRCSSPIFISPWSRIYLLDSDPRTRLTDETIVLIPALNCNEQVHFLFVLLNEQSPN